MSGPITRFLRRWWTNNVATVAILLGRRQRAIEVYQRLVELDPSDEAARGAIGHLLAESGDATGAITEFEQVVALNPRHADVWFNLGYLHDQRDELEVAERCFRAAIGLKPKLDRAWYGLGLVLIRAGRLTEAVEALKKNTELQPFSPYGWYQLGMTHHHLGNAANARRICEELQKFEPRYAATLKRDMERTPSRAAQTSDSPSHRLMTQKEALQSAS